MASLPWRRERCGAASLTLVRPGIYFFAVELNQRRLLEAIAAKRGRSIVASAASGARPSPVEQPSQRPSRSRDARSAAESRIASTTTARRRVASVVAAGRARYAAERRGRSPALDVNGVMALEMRSDCERCHAALAHSSLAYICSYECTFCPSCTEQMRRRCTTATVNSWYARVASKRDKLRE
jgi:hypothetical protein